MRIRLLIFAAILFLVIIQASAQTTTVTGQVTDSGGQSWNNGTFLFTLQGGTGAIWTGGTLNRSIPAAGPGNLSSSGAIPSTGVPDTGTITPSGSTWRLTVCSATVPQQCFAQNLTITGASQVLTVTPPAISIQVSNSPVFPPPVIVAYADSEISGAWQGFSYFNAVTLSNRTCSAGTVGVTGPCTAYVAGGSGSGLPTGGLIGQIPVNTAPGVGGWQSSGIADGNSGLPVTTTPYQVLCDSATAIRDRLTTIRFQSGASVVNMPDHTASGCGASFTVVLLDDGAGTLTVNSGGSDTFSTLNGSTNTDGATSFTLTNGQYATLNNGAGGIWEVRIMSSSGGGSSTGCEVKCTWIPIFNDVPQNPAGNNPFTMSSINQPVAMRLYLPLANKATTIYYDILTADAGKHMDFGLFGPCTTTCALSWHTGSLLTTSTGFASVTITPVTEAAGTYYFAWCADTIVAAVQSMILSAPGMNALINGPANTFGNDATDTCTAGVLPASITITNVVNGNPGGNTAVPYILVSNP